MNGDVRLTDLRSIAPVWNKSKFPLGRIALLALPAVIYFVILAFLVRGSSDNRSIIMVIPGIFILIAIFTGVYYLVRSRMAKKELANYDSRFIKVLEDVKAEMKKMKADLEPDVIEFIVYGGKQSHLRWKVRFTGDYALVLNHYDELYVCDKSEIKMDLRDKIFFSDNHFCIYELMGKARNGQISQDFFSRWKAWQDGRESVNPSVPKDYGYEENGDMVKFKL